MYKDHNRSLFVVTLFLFTSWLSLVKPVTAFPSDSRFELLSAQIFSDAKYMALKNDTAYCAFDPGLVIIDFSDPANPILISETFLNSSPNEIHLLEETAIMLAPSNGLIIVDVSDVRDPLVTSEFLNYPSPISMTLADSIGFLLYRTDIYEVNGLVTLDLSDPVEPRILDSLEMEVDFEQIAIWDERAFVAANREGIMVFDIERPDSLELVFQYDPFKTQYVTHCVVRDSLVYIGSRVSRWVQILAMTPGDSLILIGQVTSGIDFRAMTLVQDYLYVSGFQIIDVSDPTDPVIVTNLGLNHSAHQFILHDSIFYVPNRSAGIEVWDVESPVAPVLLGTYDPFYFQAIDVDTDHAYMTRWEDGLYIYSISEPQNPRFEGYIQQEGSLRDVLVRDDLAYIANGKEGLIILDVSNPSQPQWVAQYKDSTSYSWGLTLRDTLLFIAEDRYGMKIIDISDPYNPTWISSFEPSIQGYALGIALGGNIAYIANYRGIVAVDILDPYNPEEIAVYNDEENRKMDIAYHNNKIYYSDYHLYEFYIRDVTDPYNSNLLYRDYLGEVIYGEDFLMSFPVLFSADYLVSAIDISDSQAPSILEQFASSHMSYDLAGNDSLIYSVGNSFVILDFDREGLGINDEIPETKPSLPKTFSLSQNYPNPFNPSTTIRYEIPGGSRTVPVKVDVYDIRGRLVRKLVNQEKASGRYQVNWDGRDEHGQQVSSGVYLYRMEINSELVSTKKMVLLK